MHFTRFLPNRTNQSNLQNVIHHVHRQVTSEGPGWERSSPPLTALAEIQKISIQGRKSNFSQIRFSIPRSIRGRSFTCPAMTVWSMLIMICISGRLGSDDFIAHTFVRGFQRSDSRSGEMVKLASSSEYSVCDLWVGCQRVCCLESAHPGKPYSTLRNIVRS